MTDTCGFLFYVIMQKRGDGRVYCDMNKTDEKIYYTKDDADRALASDPELAQYRHVVGIVACLATPEEMEFDQS